jgi:hypoxanthine phosphoribosyltransferase
MIVSRYGKSRTPGDIHVVTDLPPRYRDLNGKHVIILDGLVDGGVTIDYTQQHLLSYGASKVECVVLVKKRKSPPVDTRLAMYGFDAPDVWLTGMGMDDERLAPEGNRWAGWIAIASRE